MVREGTNLDCLLAVAGLWAGAPTATLGSVSGIWGDASHILRVQELTRLLRSFPVLSWLQPSPKLFGNAVLVTNTETGTQYTAADLGRLLVDAGAQQAAAAWRRLHNVGDLSPPRVATYCFYSTGVSTPSGFEFSTLNFTSSPSAIYYNDGDGTVTAGSLSVCDHWKVQQVQSVIVKQYRGIQHGAILFDSRVATEVLQTVQNLNGVPHAAGKISQS